MLRNIGSYLTIFLFIKGYAFAQTSDNPFKVQPGFTCSAIMSSVRLLLPIQADQQTSTEQMLRQLQIYQAYYLKRPQAPATQKQFLIHSGLDQLSDSDRLKVAGQINGILQDGLNPADSDSMLRVGISLKGVDSAVKYFSELEAMVKTYQDMMEADDLNPENRRLLWSVWLTRVAGSVEAYYGLKDLIHPHDLSAWTLIYLYYGWQFLSVGSVPYNQKTSELSKLLVQAKVFLEQSSPERRILAFSHRYRVLPQTYQESWEDGIMQTQTLVKESISAHRAVIPGPPSLGGILQGKLKLTKIPKNYVTVDFVLESTGPNPEDTSLYIYLRATKSKPKPKKPNIPASESKREWKLVPGILQSAPILNNGGLH